MRWNIAGVGEVVGAFGRGEGVERLAEGVPEGRDGSLGGGSQQGLELGEDLLDRVQIGRVRWQIEQVCATGLDGFTHASHLVRAAVVHDHDVARSERRGQSPLDIGANTFAVDGTVEDARCGDPVMTQRREEGARLPVAMGYGGHQALPAPGPAMAPGHGRRGPGFVDKHQALGAPCRLPLAPRGPRPGDVRAVLLGGVPGLFFRVSPWFWRNRPSAERLVRTPLAARPPRRSSRVRSGRAATRASTRSAWGTRRERFQPPYRSGATVPRRRPRCISLTTKLTLTSNLAALARQDAPASTERTTRARRSKEYGRAIHRWPPRPSNQFESQQPHVVNPKSIPSNQEPL